MPALYFDTRRKNRYIQEREKSSGPQQYDTMDVNAQHYVARNNTKQPACVKTIQLSFNEGCTVTDSLFQSLLPDTTTWEGLPIAAPIDAAFSEDIKNHLMNIHNSKKTQLFLGGIKGFGPQFGFTASLQPGTTLQQAIEKKITTLALSKDGTTYRLIDQGIAIYYGPKGEEKKTQRQSNKEYTIDDIDYDKFARELNIMVKFSLAIQTSSATADIPLRYFFNDIEPYALVDIAINMHVTKANDHDNNSLECMSDIMGQVESKLDEFNAFIQRNLAIPNMTNPSKIQPSTQWGSMAPCESYSPTKEAFKFRTIAENNHTKANKSCGDLPETTSTVSLDPPQTASKQPKGCSASANSSDEKMQPLTLKQKKQLKKKEEKKSKQPGPQTTLTTSGLFLQPPHKNMTDSCDDDEFNEKNSASKNGTHS